MLFRKTCFLFCLVALTCCSLDTFAREGVNYTEQDLNFVSKGNQLSGKLILPKARQGKLPVIIFVHGSGPEDYSSSDNYRYLWEEFAKIGFACYAWDRPGVGQSQGKWYTCSMEDRAAEVTDAVNQLKTISAVDSSKIGYWGISQAGWVIPLAAQKAKPAFVITVSSPVTTAFEQELYRVQAEMQAEGYSNEDINKALTYNRKLRAMIQTNQPYDSFRVLQKEIEGAKWADLLISGDDVVYDYLSVILKNDKAPDLQALRCPVLAIWGANDLLVPAKKSFEVYQKELKRMGNRKLTARILPEADHTLTFNKTGKRSETIARREQYKDKPEAIFTPGYVSLMTNWLKALPKP